MGQSLYSMSRNQSKDELLFQLVTAGDVEAIRALCRQGTNLECIDKKGRTPLILACLDSGLFNVAKTLIELGANVNAYRPGGHAGTPLHHAAKRGREQTVKLLLCSGANALVRNDDCYTALDVARMKGHTHVVRSIENHICYFSGWLRELHGPGFLEALAPQLLSRKIWVVVIRCGPSNPMKPSRLELAIYPSLQDAQPRTVIPLWKAKIEEPKFHQSNPGLIVYDHSTKTRYKFASANEGDKRQLHRLYDACRGIHQVTPPPIHHDTETLFPSNEDQTSAEAMELAKGISASIESAKEERPPLTTHQDLEPTNLNGWGDSAHGDRYNGWGPSIGLTHSEASSSGWMDGAAKEEYNSWGVPTSGAVQNSSSVQVPNSTSFIGQTTGGGGSGSTPSVLAAPSAPLIPDEALDEGPIHYPSIDFTPVDLSVALTEHKSPERTDVKGESSSSSCIICWEAPVEGACIPCGHMAGCMGCLSEIKVKKGVCPVCRSKINQVIRLYAV